MERPIRIQTVNAPAVKFVKSTLSFGKPQFIDARFCFLIKRRYEAAGQASLYLSAGVHRISCELIRDLNSFAKDSKASRIDKDCVRIALRSA